MQFLFSTLLSFLDLVWNRWAVSSVMTRQNQIPTEDGRRVTLALIPLWDMCNHRNGLVRLQHTLTHSHSGTHQCRAQTGSGSDFPHVIMANIM